MRCLGPLLLPFLVAAAAVPAGAQELEVDVELVLAVDISWSMDAEEQATQRRGYVEAFRSPEVRRAILGGGWGRIAVAYVEWAGTGTQSLVVPWTLIDSAESADAFAARLTEAPTQRRRRTSISGALDFALPLFDGNGFTGLRRVVDVSGDGPNNEGRPVTASRDAAAASGVTVNGLALMTAGDAFGFGWIADLDRYYEACVVGGPGAFTIAVEDWDGFPAALRRKLVLELALMEPKPGVDEARVVPVDTADEIDCLIGERLWRQRQDGWGREAPIP